MSIHRIINTSPLSRRVAVVLLTAAAVICCSATALGATFTVNDAADNADITPADGICATSFGNCTLRAAVQTANDTPGVHTINVPAGTYALANSLVVGADVTINGAGAGITVINGNGVNRIFLIGTGATVKINDLSLINGSSSGGAAMMIVDGAKATLARTILSNNRADVGPTLQGGAILLAGTLDLIDSTVSNNTGTNGGGGLQIRSAGVANIIRSTFSGNQSNALGAAGGAIANEGTLTLTNSTISGNTSNLGAGVYTASGAATTIRFSTITANAASSGEAQLVVFGAGALLNISGSIVSSPVSGVNCSGTSGASLGNNLDSANTCAFSAAGDLINSNPLLSPLANNGGATQTHALQAGSPAINAGPTTGTIPANDQRGAGYTRVLGGAADIGAYESSSAAVPVVAPSITSPTPTPAGIVGTTYNFQVLATGTAPIVFSIGSGNLPPGLAIGSNGLISGTPNSSGTYSGTIIASNGVLPNASQPFAITIAPAAAVATATPVPLNQTFTVLALFLTVLGIAINQLRRGKRV